MGRPLNTDEKRLVVALIKRAQLNLPSNWPNDARVTPMNDGGMGSLRFLPLTSGQRISRQVAELQFRDVDGVDVIASLSLDEAGQPFELDIWKVNFKPLIQIPEEIS